MYHFEEMAKTLQSRAMSKSWPLWLPILIFLLIAPFTPTLDLSIAHFFYQPDGFIKQSDAQHPIHTLFYTYGNLPGQILGVGAAILALLSLRYPILLSWRKGALVVAITGIVGAGLFVNVLLKEYWARPRPKQLTEFGGSEAYYPFYIPMSNPPRLADDKQFKSFPSGHAAMGFLFLSLGLVGWYERNLLLYGGGITLGLLLGTTFSYARMAQGGHFFSDILFSALLMWLVAVVAGRIVYGRAPWNP